MSHATTADETPASQPSTGEPTDPDPSTSSRSPSRASSRTLSKNTPLLTLAPTGRQTPQDEDIPAIWNGSLIS